MKGKLALLLVTLIVCLGISEVALRVLGFGQPLIHSYDPDLLWTMPPNSTAYAPSYGVGYEVNSQGWREGEIPRERSPGELRILALGDSVLFGQGIPQDETFSERLEAMLASSDAVASAEVINTGVSGYAVPQYRVVLERTLSIWRPDLVLMLFVKNDAVSAQDVEELRENARSGRQANVDTLHARARRASALLHAVDGLVGRFRAPDRSPRALRYDRSTIAPEAWSHTLSQIEAIADELDEKSVPLVIVTLPLAREVRSGSQDVTLAPLEQLSSSRGVHLLALWPTFAAAAEEKLFLDDVHPTSRGHELAAQAVQAYLRERGLVP